LAAAIRLNRISSCRPSQADHVASATKLSWHGQAFSWLSAILATVEMESGEIAGHYKIGQHQ